MRRPVKAKNTGKSRTELKFSTRTTSLSRKLPAVGMTIPARKAPKSARIPMSCVLSAEASTTPKTTASTPLLGLGRSNACCPSQFDRFGLMTSSMSATKSNTRPRLNAVAPTLVARAIATTNASTLHAVTSPTAAQAVAVRPSEVLKIARSCKIRSRTGKAVILMEIPIKRAKPVNDAPG